MPSPRQATMPLSPGITAPGLSGRFDGIRRVVGEIRRSYAQHHVRRD